MHEYIIPNCTKARFMRIASDYFHGFETAFNRYDVLCGEDELLVKRSRRQNPKLYYNTLEPNIRIQLTERGRDLVVRIGFSFGFFQSFFMGLGGVLIVLFWLMSFSMYNVGELPLGTLLFGLLFPIAAGVVLMAVLRKGMQRMENRIKTELLDRI